MEPTLAVGERVIVNRIGNRFAEPQRRRHRRLPPAARRRRQTACGGPAEAVSRARALPARARPQTRSNRTSSSASSACPGDRIADPRRPRRAQRRAAEGEFIRACGGGERVQLPGAITVPAGHYFMMGDNRGASDDSRFWGPVPRDWIIGGAFVTYWPPEAHRPPLRRGRARPSPRGEPPGARREPAAQPRRERQRPAQAVRASIARSARASSPAPTRPGRGCLAGPLVAAAVLFDYERLTAARRARARGAQRLQAADARRARGALPARPAHAPRDVAVVSRCARGIDATACTRRTSRRCATRSRASRATGLHLPSDGFPVGDVGHQQRAVIGGDATSAAIAAASVLAKVTRDRYMRRADALHPGWEFAAPRRLRDARAPRGDRGLGVSPLHRLSFQSHRLSAARRSEAGGLAVPKARASRCSRPTSRPRRRS